MHNLLVSGFQLSEMIHFLDHSKLVDQRFVHTMRTSLTNGETISQILASLQFSKSVITQVALANFCLGDPELGKSTSGQTKNDRC